MTDAFIRVPHLVEGDKIDNAAVTTGSGAVYRQRTECYPGDTFPVSGPLTLALQEQKAANDEEFNRTFLLLVAA